jgi:hypothetical protein
MVGMLREPTADLGAQREPAPHGGPAVLIFLEHGSRRIRPARESRRAAKRFGVAPHLYPATEGATGDRRHSEPSRIALA